jgi:hypothetical protein
VGTGPLYSATPATPFSGRDGTREGEGWQSRHVPWGQRVKRGSIGYELVVRLLLPLLVLGLIVLFFAGLIAPRRSKRLQGWMDERLQEGQSKSEGSGGRVGDWVAKTLYWLRRAGDKSAEVGRRFRNWLSR